MDNENNGLTKSDTYSNVGVLISGVTLGGMVRVAACSVAVGLAIREDWPCWIDGLSLVGCTDGDRDGAEVGLAVGCCERLRHYVSDYNHFMFR